MIDMTQPLLTPGDVCKELDCTSKELNALISAEKLPYYKIGRAKRFDKQEILKFSAAKGGTQ